jgi:hypothetical protein
LLLEKHAGRIEPQSNRRGENTRPSVPGCRCRAGNIPTRWQVWLCESCRQAETCSAMRPASKSAKPTLVRGSNGSGSND